MLQIDSYAYINRLFHIHPGEKIAFSMLIVLICIFSPSIISPLTAFILMVSLTILAAGIPWRPYLKLLTIPILFILLGSLTTAVSFTKNLEGFISIIRFNDFYLGFFRNDLVFAMHLFVKSLSATSCLLFLAFTTPIVEVSGVLRRVGFPSLVLELITLTHRFIFVFLETAQKIIVSQSSRLGYRNLKTSYSSLGQLAGSLFISSYLQSQALYLALLARGYNGELKVLESEYSICYVNIFAVVITGLLIAGLNFV